MNENNPKGAGRKPLPEGKLMKAHMVRMTDEQWQFVQKMGGSKWLRNVIDLLRKGKD